MNSRNSVAVAVVGIVLLALIFFFAWPRESVNTKVPVLTPDAYKVTNTAKRYSVNAQYPVLSGMSRSDVEAKVNKEISSDVKTLAVAFEADAEDVTPELLAHFPVDAISSLEMSYQVHYLDAHLLSLEFENTVYSIGAAHPGNFTTTLLYDLDTGTAVPLRALFKPGTDYLNILSVQSRTLLKKDLGPDVIESMLEDGTNPQLENYKSYLVGADGITLLFDPAQVAPSVAGVRRITIPFTSLAGKIEDRYVLIK